MLVQGPLGTSCHLHEVAKYTELDRRHGEQLGWHFEDLKASSAVIDIRHCKQMSPHFFDGLVEVSRKACICVCGRNDQIQAVNSTPLQHGCEARMSIHLHPEIDDSIRIATGAVIRTEGDAGGPLHVKFVPHYIASEFVIAALGQRFSEILPQATGAGVVLDFSNLQFFSSAALGKLISLDKWLNEKPGGKVSLTLCCVSPELQELFDLTKLSKYFSCADDFESAVSAMTH